MSKVVVEFTMDHAYYKAFHSEWVAALGKGWRVDRVMIPTFVVGGGAIVAAGLALHAPALIVGGGTSCVLGAIEFVKGRRKKAQWLAHVLALPWSGRTMRIEVDSGALVQKNEFEGDPRFQRTGELLDTPNGYLLRYQAEQDTARKSAISSTSASVYIPHQSIEPSMTRAEFRALLN